MNVPEQLQAVDRQEAVIREYGDDHETAIAADFGPDAGDIAVDVVDDTAVVVVGDDQFEFELPDESCELRTNNGVLTIEG